MLPEKEQAVKNVASVFQNLKPGGPAPKVKAAPSEPKKKPKRSDGAGEAEEAASVKPKPNPKKRPEDKKEKGKGDGKDKGRSASVDKKKTPCKFHAKGKCTQGKGCPYSHKKTRTPSRSTSPGREGKVACWSWIRGNCPKAKDCEFDHDPKAAPKKETSVQQLMLMRTSQGRSPDQNQNLRQGQEHRRWETCHFWENPMMKESQPAGR